MKNKLTDYWNWRSASYHEEFSDYLTEEINFWQKAFSEILPRNKHLKIAEIGTGPGIIALALAGMNHDVIGIDLSEEMIKKAKSNAEKLNIEAEFETGDAENIDLESNCYDLVISKYLMWTLLHPDRFLEESKRILTPGGNIILIDGLWYTDSNENNIKIQNGIKKDTKDDIIKHFEESYQDIKPNLPFGKNNTPEKIVAFIQKHHFVNPKWRYLNDYQEYILKYDKDGDKTVPYIIYANKQN